MRLTITAPLRRRRLRLGASWLFFASRRRVRPLPEGFLRMLRIAVPGVVVEGSVSVQVRNAVGDLGFVVGLRGP